MVLADGNPLGRARVTLYQDGKTIFRRIGYASVLTSAEGEYSFTLEPGSYYVVARKRAGEDRMGPLGGGDFFGYAHENPVVVEKDAYSVVAIHSVNKLVKVKEGGQEVTLGGTVKSGETVVEGVVRDRDGKPAAGVYAHAYRDPMMTQKPDFISARTGADGAYVIHLSEGGEYFVGARNTMGGPAKIKAITPITGRVLDTCTGLGYTAIEAARTAESVITIELDPAAQEVARFNPWSRSLFDNPKITQIVGDAFEVVPSFEDGMFSCILHDPPTLSLAGELYSGEFYRDCWRVLRRNGKLFHYIGDPDSKSGARTTKGVVRRLQEAGFTRVVPKPQAFGVAAYK